MTYSIKNINSLIIGFIVLLAFVVKSFIPVGFMPSFGMSDTKTMVLCTSHGQKTVHVGEDNNLVENEETEKSSDSSDCHYAVSFSKGLNFVSFYSLFTHILEETYIAVYSASFSLNKIIKYYYSQAPPYNYFN